MIRSESVSSPSTGAVVGPYSARFQPSRDRTDSRPAIARRGAGGTLGIGLAHRERRLHDRLVALRLRVAFLRADVDQLLEETTA